MQSPEFAAKAIELAAKEMKDVAGGKGLQFVSSVFSYYNLNKSKLLFTSVYLFGQLIRSILIAPRRPQNLQF